MILDWGFSVLSQYKQYNVIILVIWEDETLLQLQPGLQAFKRHRRLRRSQKVFISLHFLRSMLSDALCAILPSSTFSRLLQLLCLKPLCQVSTFVSSLGICLPSIYMLKPFTHFLHQVLHATGFMLVPPFSVGSYQLLTFVQCQLCDILIMSFQRFLLDFVFQTVPSQSTLWCFLLCIPLLAEQGGLEILGFIFIFYFLSEL